MVRMSLEQAMQNPSVREAIAQAQRGDLPLLVPGQVFAFEAFGKPIEQGSMTGFVDPRTGKVLVKQAEGLPQWRMVVRRAAQLAMRGRAPVGAYKPMLLGCEFRFDRPAAGKPGSKMSLDWPVLGHDQDKLVRGVRDALTGVCYADDGQVIGACFEYAGRLCGLPDFKRYTRPGERPGVTVRLCLVAQAQRELIAT